MHLTNIKEVGMTRLASVVKGEEDSKMTPGSWLGLLVADLSSFLKWGTGRGAGFGKLSASNLDFQGLKNGDIS